VSPIDVLDPVSPRVEPRELESPLVDVDPHHAFGVASGEERVDPGACPEIERGMNGAANRQPGKSA
jgi:hypothetical protein